MWWIILISLAAALSCEAEAQCSLSDYPSNATRIDLTECSLTSLDPTTLTRFTIVEDVKMNGNQLTEFPDLTPIGNTLTYLSLPINKIRNISNERLIPLTRLHFLNLADNKLTTFPDLSPIGGTLMTLQVDNNEIIEIDKDVLLPLTKLAVLGLPGNRLTTFPDLSPIGGTLVVLYIFNNQCGQISKDALRPLKRLKELHMNNNKLTSFPDMSPVGETLTYLGFATNQIEQIDADAFVSLIHLEKLKLNGNMNLKSFPHPVDGLRRIKFLSIHDTGISYLPPILHENIAILQLKMHNSVDVCKCENAWLKQEGPKMATFDYDDENCDGKLWSTMTFDDMITKCMQERRKQRKSFALSKYITTATSVKPFLLNAYEPRYAKGQCAMKCMDTVGCVSFYWRALNNLYGDCVIIAPGNSTSVSSVPNGDLKVWAYFPVV